ncbi:MAG: hypothetical protein ACRCX2_36960 [Paraclostridium sp.]
MDMELMRYMMDKTSGHGLCMDLTMGVCILDHYKTSGGFLVDEFRKLIGNNYGKVMESFIKQRLITVNGDSILVTREFYSLRARAEAHFEKDYSGVITVF